ncbi:NAD(P)-binding oxidoreductase [Janthinobacterium sp.]|uniref:NAD(P)-binding oxidoreductase n=1 Tax=Janthinobacterium sp. TaxID=1871054 RepID=UPI002619D6EA|nr:NAD(P)-binding oxidoreductase [Janthinobacterium sp.]
MKRYAVIGASSGTGREIVAALAARNDTVRAISRHPLPGSATVEPYAADVTDAKAMTDALAGGFDAVFYTVDIHGKKLTREQIRAVMYEGCVNAMAAAKEGGAKRFVLLSVIGPQRASWVWWLLSAMKPGMRDNIIRREQALMASGLGYVICRAPRLQDGSDTLATAAAPALRPPGLRLDMRRHIKRGKLARALIDAADHAPAASVWDVFADQAGPVPAWLTVDA